MNMKPGEEQQPAEQDAAFAEMVGAGLGEAPAEQPPAEQAPAEAKPEATAEATEEATQKASPNTEGDKVKASPVIKVPRFDAKGEQMKGDKGEPLFTEMSEKQAAGIFARYPQANHASAQLRALEPVFRPVMDMVAQYKKDNPNATKEDIAGVVESLIKGAKPEPTMGHTAPDAGKAEETPPNAQSLKEQLEAYKEENAVDLPPGYESMMEFIDKQKSAGSDPRLDNIEKMLTTVLAQAQGNTDAAAVTMQDSRAQQQKNMEQTIRNNLNSASQEFGITKEDRDAFSVYMAERGYDFSDFFEPDFTRIVMKDFATFKNSEEAKVLAEQHNKRRAAIQETGGLGSSPAGGDSTGAISGDDETFAGVIDGIYQKRA